MIIVSKFHDFYDSLCSQYCDKSVVYNRNTEIKCLDEWPELLSWAKNHVWGSIIESPTDGDIGEIQILVIGGKTYPFTFTPINIYQKEYTFKNPYSVVDSLKHKRKRFIRQKYKVFQGELNSLLYKYCQNISPIFIIRFGLFNSKYKYIIEINPMLRNIHPPVSSWEVYQSVMSVLGAREPNIPEMDNLVKINAAGFDTVKSFRPKIK